MLILTITHGMECLCGRPGVQCRSSSTPLEERNQRLEALKKVRVMVLLYLHHPFPEVAQLSAKRKLLVHDFSWEGKREHASESCWTQLPSPSIQKTEVYYMTRGRVWLRGQQPRLSECIKGTWILLTISQTPSGSLPISHWVPLA